MDAPLKRCTRCGEFKPIECFSIDRHIKKDGLKAACKACIRSQAQKDKDKIAKRDAEYRRKNIDRCRERDRAYHLANSEKRLDKSRNYRNEHKEKMREYLAEYRKNNRDKIREYRHARRARLRDAKGSHSTKETKDLFKRQKERCYYCACKLIDPFTNQGDGTIAHIDHVIPLKRGGRNDIGNIVWACRDCNLRKKDKMPHEWNGGNGRLI